MTVLIERKLRHMIRRILREDAYDMGRFSTERLKKNIEAYTTGVHTQRGARPEHVKEVTLDDLRVAFGELGFDVYTSLQGAVADNDRGAVESEIREILSNQFLKALDPSNSMGINRLEDILLPGDVDELVKLITDDMLDGDGLVTLN